MAQRQKLVLPDAPKELQGAVKAWRETVTIATYEPQPANRNPIFLENRVYQGSSGKVYPLGFIERISQTSLDRQWDAVHIENEFIRVMVLPGLGGRIHIGFDKTNDYDFFYRQNVIKPALVGLAGPWASGGVEFNWPQHHRPATYLPVETTIEEHADGSITIWCSDHDPFERLKGVHGVCLHPGRSVLEVKVRLYNRTPLTQTFLWWANAAVRVHEQYQSFFPPDVHFVADHAKRAMSSYPLCEGTYYGIDYAQRANKGIPAEEMPPHFVPPGTYAANDLRWYANIPVPTSYMAIGSREDFFGGYDHLAHAGVVHVANHHSSPGKKQWTWGNQEFGYSWDRLLTDDDGPYIELMAGVFTDNQPDFSFLAPGETKSFSQYWYPIRDLGPAQAANLRAACFAAKRTGGGWSISLNTTEPMGDVRMQAHLPDGQMVAERIIKQIGPAQPCRLEMEHPMPPVIHLRFSDSEGRELLCYEQIDDECFDGKPEAAQEPPEPRDVESLEELVVIGHHLEQYRHATRDPADYWQEGLRRDAGESRCHEALGRRHLRRGEFRLAEEHFLASTTRLTMLNPNPSDGSSLYHLGLARRFLGKNTEAYDSLCKATWNYAWRSAGHHALAEIDAAAGRIEVAIQHLRDSLRDNQENLRARNLLAVLLYKSERSEEAKRLTTESLALDPTDAWTRYLSDGTLPIGNQMLLDLAFDYMRSGLYTEALNILQLANADSVDGSIPMVRYAEAYCLHLSGLVCQSKLLEAREARSDYCFPSRLEEMVLLEWASEREPDDARAGYYLGNLLYDKQRHEDAIGRWERATKGNGMLPTVWRNLGIAYYNARADAKSAKQAYELAFRDDPEDARVFYERDQLWKRIGESPERRLQTLAQYPQLVDQRDDLSLEQIALLNQTGKHRIALERLQIRRFQPWEGGEGLVREQYVRSQLALGREALVAGEWRAARDRFAEALDSPHNLGEVVHPLANRANIFFWLSEGYQLLGNGKEARSWREKAVASEGDFQHMSVQNFSALTFYRILSLSRMGNTSGARELAGKLRDHIDALDRSVAKIDYFATSLPNTLLFREDLQCEQNLFAKFLRAQLLFALADSRAALDLLGEILTRDPSHGAAAELREEFAVLQVLGVIER